MDSSTIGASTSMLKSAQDIQASAVSQLMQGGLQAVNSTMSSADNALRTSVMQSQGIGQHLDKVV